MYVATQQAEKGAFSQKKPKVTYLFMENEAIFNDTNIMYESCLDSSLRLLAMGRGGDAPLVQTNSGQSA